MKEKKLLGICYSLTNLSFKIIEDAKRKVKIPIKKVVILKLSVPIAKKIYFSQKF